MAPWCGGGSTPGSPPGLTHTHMPHHCPPVPSASSSLPADTKAEKETGLNREIFCWASESRSNRGFKAVLAEIPAETPAEPPARV